MLVAIWNPVEEVFVYMSQCVLFAAQYKVWFVTLCFRWCRNDRDVNSGVHKKYTFWNVTNKRRSTVSEESAADNASLVFFFFYDVFFQPQGEVHFLACCPKRLWYQQCSDSVKGDLARDLLLDLLCWQREVSLRSLVSIRSSLLIISQSWPF